jgi:catechol 2,3-dioxygenase-like lactoylglutathione lyase family enzyme
MQLQHTTITNAVPVIRINNREANINFYVNILGFKKITEENAITIFGNAENDEKFIIEESPSMRTHAVEDGIKKLAKLEVLASKDDILILIAQTQGKDAHYYKGKNGYAFEVVSPEGDHVLVHAGDLASDLVEVAFSEVPSAEFDSETPYRLADYQLIGLTLNVPDLDKAAAFYDSLFEVDAEGRYLLGDLRLSLQASQGQYLIGDVDHVWDLEFIELKVSSQFSLTDLGDGLRAQGYDVFINVNAHLLTVKDTSEIELWFMK